MDEIIGLLFLIVPVVFSLIGKKLEKASKGDGVELPELPELPDLPEPIKQAPETEKTFQTVMKQQPSASRLQTAKRSVALKTEILKEEKPRKKDPIDPKKLVIYSEIMKPKF